MEEFRFVAQVIAFWPSGAVGFDLFDLRAAHAQHSVRLPASIYRLRNSRRENVSRRPTGGSLIANLLFEITSRVHLICEKSQRHNRTSSSQD